MTGFRHCWAWCGALATGLACGQDYVPAVPFTGDAATCCAPTGKGGWIVGAEFLRLRAYGAGGDVGANNTSTTPALTTYRQLMLQPRPDAGFRISAGYRDAAGFDTVVRWFNFHADAARGYQPASAAGTIVNAAFAQSLFTLYQPYTEAQTAVNVNALDLERGLSLEIDDRLLFRAFGGLRYLQLRRGLEIDYPGQFSSFTAESSRFNGFGLRFGADSEYRVHGPWGVYARGAVAGLAGRMSASNLSGYVLAPPDVVASETRRCEQRVVPSLEMAMGLTFRTQAWRIVGGYELQHFFSGVRGTAITYTPNVADLSLSGWMLRAEVGY